MHIQCAITQLRMHMVHAAGQGDRAAEADGHHADYLALHRRMAASRMLHSRFASRILRCYVTLSEPLLIQVPRFTG